jgi:hypothetical protein
VVYRFASAAGAAARAAQSGDAFSLGSLRIPLQAVHRTPVAARARQHAVAVMLA